MTYYEYRAHTVALLIAVLGPLVNLVFGFNIPVGAYLYWTICLLIYIIILIPFTYRSPLTLIRLIILGITVEDFSSHVWRSLFLGTKFLPLCNWYAQYFPFIGTLGEPTPYILIPKWYFLAILVYILISTFQFRKEIEIKFLKHRKKPLR